MKAELGRQTNHFRVVVRDESCPGQENKELLTECCVVRFTDNVAAEAAVIAVDDLACSDCI